MATFVTLAGALTTQDGKRFNWTKPARWTSERVFVDAAGATVASFNPTRRGTVVALAQRCPPCPNGPCSRYWGSSSS